MTATTEQLLAAIEDALRDVCEKISIGEAMVLPDGSRNACDIFHALLEMHGLWREPAALADQPKEPTA